jgi:hypothetical protein
MSLGIRQEATYADGRWDWSIWIDGPDVELDQVESVEWVLHPTFPEPIVRVKQRQSKFRLDSFSLGEFEINAHVTAKSGRRQHLKHWLRLPEPEDESIEPASAQKHAVFISASAADADWEEAVQDALARRGFDVLTSNDLPAGLNADAAISSTLDKAATLLCIFSDESAPWTEREVVKAREKNIAVVPFGVGEHPKIPLGLQGMRVAKVPDLGGVDAAIGQIADRLA